MIIDKARVYFQAGKGGEGGSFLLHLSSHKTSGSGGDGGRGADIYLQVNPHYYDLRKFKSKNRFRAPDGGAGKDRNQRGKDASNLFVDVPPGTRILDEEGNLIADLLREGEKFLLCKGGKPGKGNSRRGYTVPSGEGESRTLNFDYRIPNDIAILGLPNSGKTTLFNSLTGQSFKTADYPFTTLNCMVSKFSLGFNDYKMLDTPPLKTGEDKTSAHNSFLRHILRSRLLIFLSGSPKNYRQDFKIIEKEILAFRPDSLEGKKIFHLVNKIDKIDKIDKTPRKAGMLFISAKLSEGLEELKEILSKNLK